MFFKLLNKCVASRVGCWIMEPKLKNQNYQKVLTTLFFYSTKNKFRKIYLHGGSPTLKYLRIPNKVKLKEEKNTKVHK